MSLTLSVCTTLTNPRIRGDNYLDALQCYKDLADELVIVSGGLIDYPQIGQIKSIYNRWPQEFSWELIGHQFTLAYQMAKSDWVLKLDIDTIIHEGDFKHIREVMEHYNEYPAVGFYKYQFILPDRYNLKSRLVLLANKRRFGERIKFNAGGDAAQISLDQQFLSSNQVPESKIAVWNYEKILKTKEQIADDQGRMERAYQRYFGRYQMGSDGTNRDAYDKWVQAQIGKFNKPQEHIKLEQHPKYIQDTIKSLKPEQWGYSGFGLLGKNDYVL